MPVDASLIPLTLPTYPVGEPDKNPLFLEKRVYQGSCGKVYPIPFIDKVYDDPIDTTYQAALLENDFVKLTFLPEIGGRVFSGLDKTNNYDFLYRQDVIKPALVGLAGPWISGGIEFNWPQHHRPGTFLPSDIHIEHETNGAATVWQSELDLLSRLKGMHGFRLRPDSSLIELRARLYNRTPVTQTFLWWANLAAMVHDQYQSFFPPDVTYVADHAVRALSSFPEANNPYYGVDYQNRPHANDLTWYKNIPVPTSYMICQTDFDFFGGYDHQAEGGFVHIANRHIAPGKKQWTWGNHDFGCAWDRELTDTNGPYVELMSGVYTDNQPDFSYLHPYETRSFSQYWWPIQKIGPVQQATTEAALSMTIRDDRSIQLGLCVSKKTTARLTLKHRDQLIATEEIVLSPGEAWLNTQHQFQGEHPHELSAELRDLPGKLILSYRPVDTSTITRDRAQATEPNTPENTPHLDELLLTGEHLEQYRHPTRDPQDYWKAALQKDPQHSEAHLALGRHSYRRGLFEKAREHLEAAIARLTSRHPNPHTGEAHYYLGLTLRALEQHEAAYPFFYKATWNYAWRSASFYQLATLDCLNNDWQQALEHLEHSLDTNRNNNKAHTLKALVLRTLDRSEEASDLLASQLKSDPLDHWTLFLSNRHQFLKTSRNDAQTVIDLAFDFQEAGFTSEALSLLVLHHHHPVSPAAVPNPLERSPMTHYLRAYLSQNPDHLSDAQARPSSYFFPSRLQEMAVLEWALAQNMPKNGTDQLAAYGLGNFYYDQKRHQDAIGTWEKALDSTIPQLHRNLGIAYWNVQQDGEKALASYHKAIALDPEDARLIAEIDQLTQKLNHPLEDRLAFLQEHRELIFTRDDACVSLAQLLNLTGQPAEALALLSSRKFHPWEGGEGKVLREYTTSRIFLGQKALEKNQATEALEHFHKAIETPDSLGEKYHLLQAQADINYWIGRAHQQLGNDELATHHFTLSAEEEGDFAEMALTNLSPLSYYRALSLRALGKKEPADTLLQEMIAGATESLKEIATIDYFATSLPNMLVFDEDYQARKDSENHLILALAHHGLGKHEESRNFLLKHQSFTLSDSQAHLLGRSI